jgi:excinuclease ABC subunit B
MAEDLTEYYAEIGVRVRYLHSDVETLARIELLRDLRAGEYDVLVGINLLREGLDLPEVSLVAILDADKEGFLRSHRSLIQTIGRAARNAGGQVLMYADKITAAMKLSIDETDRRRRLQLEYNEKHGITPATIRRAILDISPSSGGSDYYAIAKRDQEPTDASAPGTLSDEELHERVEGVRQAMFSAAENLEFEKAARLRDELRRLQGARGSVPAASAPASTRATAARTKKTAPSRARRGARR